MGRQAGLTLMELLIAVAVAAIIAAIAIPAYGSYVLKAKIHEAHTFLLVLDVQEQQYWNDAHNYGPSDCAVGATAGSTKYFTYLCGINNSQQGYVLTATGVGDLLGYKFELIVVDSGSGATVKTRRTVDFPGVSGLPVACWLDAPGSCMP